MARGDGDHEAGSRRSPASRRRSSPRRSCAARARPLRRGIEVPAARQHDRPDRRRDRRRPRGRPSRRRRASGCATSARAPARRSTWRAGGAFDIVMVHAKALEEKFVADGFGTERIPVMYNDFVIVGPAEDPAGIKGMKTAAEALKTIAAKGVPFISRGDKSGTHIAEMDLWAEAGVKPAGAWYTVYEKGATGNGPTLRYTNEKKAYTVIDRATYLSLQKEIALAVLVEGDEALLNFISVIPVNPAEVPPGQRRGRRDVRRLADRPGQGAGDHPGLRQGEVRRPALLPELGRVEEGAGRQVVRIRRIHRMENRTERMRKIASAVLALFAAALCSPPPPLAAQEKNLILATTTSTQDSGLLDVLVPCSRSRPATWSRRSPSAPARRWRWARRARPTCCSSTRPTPRRSSWPPGYGVDRRLVMHNDFVIVGPAADPAKIKGAKTRGRRAQEDRATAGALRLARRQLRHAQPRRRRSGRRPAIDPKGQTWYQQTGHGMGADAERRRREGPTRSPTAAPTSRRRRTLALDILVEGDEEPAERLPRHRGQPGEVAEGQRRRREGLRRLHGREGDAGRSSRSSASTSTARRSSSPTPARRTRTSASKLLRGSMDLISRGSVQAFGLICRLRRRGLADHPALAAHLRLGDADQPRCSACPPGTALALTRFPGRRVRRQPRQHRHGAAAGGRRALRHDLALAQRAARRPRTCSTRRRRWSSRSRSSPRRSSPASPSPRSSSSRRSCACRSSRSARPAGRWSGCCCGRRGCRCSPR